MTRIVGPAVSRHGRLRAFVTYSVGYANDGRRVHSLLEEIMNYDQLIKAIQENGAFSDRHHARKATEAVLSVLGERLAGAEPAHLASQLPPELAEALPQRGSAEPFDVTEFDRRVAAREEWGCSPTEAHHHAAVVLETVLGAVTPGERDDVIAQLPADFADLLPASG